MMRLDCTALDAAIALPYMRYCTSLHAAIALLCMRPSPRRVCIFTAGALLELVSARDEGYASRVRIFSWSCAPDSSLVSALTGGGPWLQREGRGRAGRGRAGGAAHVRKTMRRASAGWTTTCGAAACVWLSGSLQAGRRRAGRRRSGRVCGREEAGRRRAGLKDSLGLAESFLGPYINSCGSKTRSAWLSARWCWTRTRGAGRRARHAQRRRTTAYGGSRASGVAGTGDWGLGARGRMEAGGARRRRNPQLHLDAAIAASCRYCAISELEDIWRPYVPVCLRNSLWMRRLRCPRRMHCDAPRAMGTTRPPRHARPRPPSGGRACARPRARVALLQAQKPHPCADAAIAARR